MNIPATALTIGGLFVGLAIPLWHLTRFVIVHIKKRSQILAGAKDLIPLAAGIGYGGLATATTSGLIGGLTGGITWFGNAAGSLAMWGATGGNALLSARSNTASLTGMGNLVLMLVTVAVLSAWFVIPAKAKPGMFQGLISGVLLGLSATLGGAFAEYVIPTANSAGASLVGSIA
ncbi:hypothetical protein OG422_31205 (plasmid) [Streptomyces sp. NBC_01525]|uniref:hypothetical protein n=1 Tax=Streptomyces sp. NBC_01525 TaxID=2903893 RepID=UPI002F90E17F